MRFAKIKEYRSSICNQLLSYQSIPQFESEFCLSWNRDGVWFLTPMQRAKARNSLLPTKMAESVTLWAHPSISIQLMIFQKYPSARLISPTRKIRCRLGPALWRTPVLGAELREGDQNQRRRIIGKRRILVGIRRKMTCNIATLSTHLKGLFTYLKVQIVCYSISLAGNCSNCFKR